MRQVGVLGAPGRVALEVGVGRLAEDHSRMYKLASGKFVSRLVSHHNRACTFK